MMWSNLSAHMGMSGLGKVSPVPASPDEPGAFIPTFAPNPVDELSTTPATYVRCPEGTKRGTESVGNSFEYFCYTPEEIQQRSEQASSDYRKRVRAQQLYLISLGVAAAGILIYAPGYWKVTAVIPGGILALSFAIRGLG